MKWNSENVSLHDIKDLLTYAFGKLFDNINVIKMSDASMKELQEKVHLLTERLNIFITEKGGNDAKEEMNEETVGDTSDITDQQRGNIMNFQMLHIEVHIIVVPYHM
jgi:hypothetical protein